MSAATKAWVATPVDGIGGELRVPGDKSVSHRAMMLGGIADGVTEVSGFLESEDCLATLGAMRRMGVGIERPAPERVIVRGAGLRGLAAPTGPLDMGNAGTAMRLFTGLLSGQAFDTELIGDSSLMKRPMERVAGPLRLMGADIETRDGRPPVRIRGGRALHGIDYDLKVASAQVKSAILLAGLYASGQTSVTEHAVTRDHTERMLRAFGATVLQSGSRVAVTGTTRLEACSVEVPGDFSSAAFFLVAGALAARDALVIRNVGINPTRTGLLEILRLMGADITLDNARVAGGEPVADLVVRRSVLTGIEVPRHLVPLAIDEFPVLFVAAACARGETRVTGAEELRVKESDRIAVMAEGLRAVGVDAEPLPDGMHIRPGPIAGGAVDSHGDHRVAMSFAVASLRSRGEIRIEDVANVATSFPGFVPMARAIGADVVEVT
jgi:3-phosphoshikimate 1-carboxyvinyltransferase